MPIGVRFIVAALVFYTIAIWSERFKKELKLWMLLVFITAFLCDLGGTSIMFFNTTGRSLNLHTIIHMVSGYVALTIMSAHLWFAIQAIRGQAWYAKIFNRCSIYVWLAWLVAFVSGIPNVL
ncbi:MAG: TIGR03987 family protein [Candidatus Kerfeldbacteria bacterium]|nr:TIGR03987 family protein [Candidatus Kerfeldbacteria bacterium]